CTCSRPPRASSSSSSARRPRSRRWRPRASGSRRNLTRRHPDMRRLPRYPALYQVNTRVWLTELSRSLGRRATLDDIGDAELDRSRGPRSYTWVKRKRGDLLLAHGRDPSFSGWPDTLQLDYSNAATQRAMAAELLRIAGQCDGVRCDMAMLVLPDVFERTWRR